MSVEQFYNEFYVHVLPSSGTEIVTTRIDNLSGELKHIVMWAVVVGTLGGTERFRVKLHNLDVDDATDTFPLDAPIATSDWLNLTSFAVQSNGYNYVRFDFNNENFGINQFNIVTIESENYTKTESNFIGFLLDWPDPINTQPSATEAGYKAAYLFET